MRRLGSPLTPKGMPDEVFPLRPRRHPTLVYPAHRQSSGSTWRERHAARTVVAVASERKITIAICAMSSPLMIFDKQVRQS
jgi:hypothetical protein